MSGHNIQDMIAEFKKRKEEFIQEMMKRDEEVKVKEDMIRNTSSPEDELAIHVEKLKEKRIWIVNNLKEIQNQKKKLEESEQFLEDCLEAVDHLLKKS